MSDLRVQPVTTPETLLDPALGRSVPPLAVDDLIGHAPDMHWMARDAAGVLRARCSSWLGEGGHDMDGKTGVIGHFAADDEVAATTLLDHVTAALTRRGCTRAVGPMDGNTWRSYRFVTERGREPPFFMEPAHPPAYPTFFAAAGFDPLARYYSSLNADLAPADARHRRLGARLADRGVTLRPLDPLRFDETLDRIGRLSLEAFADNPFYAPITPAAFTGMYRPILPFLRPELVWLAEHGDELVGFVFGVPDILEADRSPTIETMIVKSLAVADRWHGQGLGGLLLRQVETAALELGFTRCIYALMHEENRSLALASRSGRIIRTYTLYGKGLAS